MKFVFVLILSMFTLQTVHAESTVLTNLHSFGTGLYRGARPGSLAALTDLQKMGVKTVIDLQGGDLLNPNYSWIVSRIEPGESAQAIAAENDAVTKLGMNFINIPLDSLDPVTPQEGQQIAALLKVINDPQNQPVFVHCEHGKDRTGLVVALYRVFYQNWSAQKAHDEMVALGHGTLNMIFTDDMDDFFWATTKGK